MNKISWYISWHLLFGIALVALILNIIFIAFSMATWSVQLLQSGWSIWQIFLHVILQAPNFCCNTFPAITAIGTLIGLSYLAQKNELVVIQSAGIKPFNIMLITLKCGMIMALLGFWLIAYFAPISNVWSDQVHTPSSTILQNIWLKAGEDYIYIKQGNRHQLQDIRIFELDAQGIHQTWYAKTAVFNHHWILQEVDQKIYYPHAVEHQTLSTLPFPPLPSPTILATSTTTKADHLTLVQLFHLIQYSAQNQLTNTNYQMRFWQILILPIATLMMMLMMVPFIFGEKRSHQFALNLTLGLGISLVFYFFNQLFTPLAILNAWPPLLAALLPPVAITTVLAGLIILFQKRTLA